MDPQNGVFVQKHIHAADPNSAVLGFLNHSEPTVQNAGYTLYGGKNMSTAKKWRAYFIKVNSVKPDIIHFHCYAPDLAPLLWFAKRAGIKTVHSEHWSGFLPQHPTPLKGWRKVIARWYMHKCDIVLPVSKILADGIKELAPKTKTQVVPNIIENRSSRAAGKRPAISICVVADIVFSIKQQDKILAVFSDLPTKQFELHFYGGGPDESALEKMIKGQSNVFLHGRKSNVEILEILPQHHALLLFSAYETFGITIFEARQAGLWAIAKHSFGGAPFYDKKCITVESVEDLKNVLLELPTLPPAGSGNFEELSPNRIGRKLSTLYSKLLFT
ncbi:MAG: hypothetical protein CL854_05515 [Cryomorphaceae bacterium]|nr:hypothetical protein [Cryomorphaceae bacterium]